MQSVPIARGWRFFASFLCLCLANLACALDATILSTSLTRITYALHGTAIEGFWAATSFLLCSTVFEPTWVSLSHVFGRKSVFMIALTIFTIGSILCAMANSFAVLITGRCVQGAGGGGLVALTYVITTDLVALRERGKWFSLVTLQWAIGAVTGPIIGGALAQEGDWRWVFWLNLPFCGIVFVGLPFCLRQIQKLGSAWTKLKAIDWVGSFLFVASLTSFLIALTWGGIQYPWSDWRTTLPLVAGIIGVLVFVFYSAYIPTDPLIRRSLFSQATANAAYVGTIMQGMILWAVLYYIPLYLEVAKHFSPVLTGVGLMSYTFTTTPTVIITGLLITKTGKYRLFTCIGWFLTTLGMCLLIVLKPSTSTVGYVFLSIPGGIGIGILLSSQSFAVQAASSNADLPFAAAMYAFFRSLGQTFGVAVGGALFQNVFKSKLTSSGIPGVTQYASLFTLDFDLLITYINDVVISEGKPADVADELVSKMMNGYVDSLRVVWIFMAVVAAVSGVLCAVFIRDISLNRELETDQGFVYDNNKGGAEVEMGAKTGAIIEVR